MCEACWSDSPNYRNTAAAMIQKRLIDTNLAESVQWTAKDCAEMVGIFVYDNNATGSVECNGLSEKLYNTALVFFFNLFFAFFIKDRIVCKCCN